VTPIFEVRRVSRHGSGVKGVGVIMGCGFAGAVDVGAGDEDVQEYSSTMAQTIRSRVDRNDGPKIKRAVIVWAAVFLGCVLLAEGQRSRWFGLVASEHQRMMSCVANLKQIQGAKEQWAVENKKTVGDPVDVSALYSYLKNSQMPQCPMKGVYTVNVVGALPACSLGATLGHTL